MSGLLRIGVDVGGTNTDAALLAGREVLATVKVETTADVTRGVAEAIGGVLAQAQIRSSAVGAVMIGTTHFLNAVIEGRHLARVAALRLCGRATRALPPFVDWPERLRTIVDGGSAMVGGGVNYDGTPIEELDIAAIRQACRAWRAGGVEAVSICGVFSLVDQRMETEAAEVVAEAMPGVAISLSHRIGRNGLLRRENATILNASLMPLGRRTIEAFRTAFESLGLACPFYLTQNDGTLMSTDFAARFPVLTLASGPTNSMRGAAFLSGLTDAVVIDIGGTTTDVGMLAGGFPRSRSEGATIGGIATNFRLPDVCSIGLGGGSVVRPRDGLRIGPDSVGYRIRTDALSFGGGVLTATDIAVAAGLARLGDPARLRDLDPSMVRAAAAAIRGEVEAVLDRMKPSATPLPVVLVGGGSILLGDRLEGASAVLRPSHFGSANAIGAAIAQVSGEVDRVVALGGTSREKARADCIADATRRAVEAGAEGATVALAEIEETPLSYLPGNATRIAVKVVGDLVA